MFFRIWYSVHCPHTSVFHATFLLLVHQWYFHVIPYEVSIIMALFPHTWPNSDWLDWYPRWLQTLGPSETNWLCSFSKLTFSLAEAGLHHAVWVWPQAGRLPHLVWPEAGVSPAVPGILPCVGWYPDKLTWISHTQVSIYRNYVRFMVSAVDVDHKAKLISVLGHHKYQIEATKAK